MEILPFGDETAELRDKNNLLSHQITRTKQSVTMVHQTNQQLESKNAKLAEQNHQLKETNVHQAVKLMYADQFEKSAKTLSSENNKLKQTIKECKETIKEKDATIGRQQTLLNFFKTANKQKIQREIETTLGKRAAIRAEIEMKTGSPMKSQKVEEVFEQKGNE